MTISPTPDYTIDDISLPENEFLEVYNHLHKLILEELELLSENVPLEGNPLIKRSLELLHVETDEKKKHDFKLGFLPLYKRMYRALKENKADSGCYTVAFS